MKLLLFLSGALLWAPLISTAEDDRVIGWNYDRDTPLAPTDTAGAPGYARSHWNNHEGIGQGPGAVPFVLQDDLGNETTATLTSWTQSSNNSWKHGQTGTPDAKLMNHFANREASLTFSNIPFGSYSVVVYYGNNEGPSSSTLTVGSQTLTITTGNTAQASFETKGYLKGTEANPATPTNYAVFEGVLGNQLTVSLSGANNNGISAVQIVEGEPVPESTTPATAAFPADGASDFKPWQFLTWNPGGAGEVGYDVYLWPDGESQPGQRSGSTSSLRFQPGQYLFPARLYNWRIVTHLQSGNTLTSPAYHFTTTDLSGQPPFDLSPQAQTLRTLEVNALQGITSLTTLKNGSYPLPDQTTLAFYGDSITDVFTYFDGITTALQAAKASDANFPEVTVLNRGINGATTDDLLNLPDGDQFSGGSGPNPPLPFSQQVDADLAALEPGGTYVAVIQIGINDVYQGDNTSAAVYQSRLETMVDYVLEKGHRVVLVSPTVINESPIADIVDDGLFDDAGNALLNGYVSALQNIADSRGLSFVDQRSAYLKIAKNENFAVANDAAGSVTYPLSTGILNSDAVHPNARGKALSSELVAGGIYAVFADTDDEVASFSPMPTSITPGEGSLTLPPTFRIFYETRTASRAIENSLLPLAQVFAGELEMRTGIKPGLVELTSENAPEAGDILLGFSPIEAPFASSEELEDQSYFLSIDELVTIRSQYYKGVAYGTATLLQALQTSGASAQIARQSIEDSPAAAFRTVMLDLARQPSSLASVREVIRLSRLHKIRYLHLHLTDDQNFTFPFEPITSQLANNFTYSREDLVELAAYADARGVTIIPELDLPGHSSKLRASGYLSPSENDADVAHPDNFGRIQAIIDDMISVFPSSPYFHIGGDESGAGESLVPFLAAMNGHLRSKPEGQKKRLLVWEGFHNSPITELPPTGDDRIVVVSWESRYNTPWNLLNAGYEVVNASWKPLYIVGSGATTRYPHVTQRMWSREVIHSWDMDRFMHWQPGVPVFEDSGPSDPISDDSAWRASYIGKEDQVIGGQLLSWEQNEKTIVRDLIPRLPVMADRLWNPIAGELFSDFDERLKSVEEGVLTIVKPVEILPVSTTPDSPVSEDYRQYEGDSITLTLRNRTKIPGTIRYELGNFNNALTSPGFDFTEVTTGASQAYSAPLTLTGGFGIRAALYRGDDGSQVEGHGWEHFNNWVNRVAVTEFEVPARPLDSVPDFASYSTEAITREYQLPLLHGPYLLEKVKGQMMRSTLTVPGTGEYQISIQTSDGHASLYLDLNKDGIWGADEKIIADSPSNDRPFAQTVTLGAGEYQLRVDHASGAIGALLWIKMDGPATGGDRDITGFLSLPVALDAPPSEPQPVAPTDGANFINPKQTLRWASSQAAEYDLYLWVDGEARPAIPTLAALTVPEFSPEGLDRGTTYHWAVLARNARGTTEGADWTFTTTSGPVAGPSVGWNYVLGGTSGLASSDIAGAPGFEQDHWNNHSGAGQGPGALPFDLVDSLGDATTVSVTGWSQSSNNSWQHSEAETPDEVLTNSFVNREVSLTFSKISWEQYRVIAYYGNNEGPSTSDLIVTGSVDDSQSRTVTTGNSSQSSFRAIGYREESGAGAGPTNYTVFEGLDDPSFTIAFSGAVNNGLSAVQIRGIVLEGFHKWQNETPGAGSSFDSNLDGDAWNDLLEYALLGDPATSVPPQGLLAVETSASGVQGIFSRPLGIADLNYFLQVSGDLETWLTLSDLIPEVEASSATTETVTYEDLHSSEVLADLEASARFYRLLVSLR
ncbi:family 20 glycosylhydrolase [Verrucomicrobiaceae bacterium 227]